MALSRIAARQRQERNSEVGTGRTGSGVINRWDSSRLMQPHLLWSQQLGYSRRIHKTPAECGQGRTTKVEYVSPARSARLEYATSTATSTAAAKVEYVSLARSVTCVGDALQPQPQPQQQNWNMSLALMLVTPEGTPLQEQQWGRCTT
jgi:hypothetical protein